MKRQTSKFGATGAICFEAAGHAHLAVVCSHLHIDFLSVADFSHFCWHLSHQLRLYREEDLIEEDGRHVSAQEIHQYLTRVMYNRRNKFNPLWNSLIVAGVDEEAGL